MSVPKGVYMANWDGSMDWIRSYFRRKPRPEAIPRLIRKFGEKNFELKGDTLYYKGLEIVTDQVRREKLISEQEKGYGGSRAIYYRLKKKYIGVPYHHVNQYLGESERRQLKANVQSAKKQRSFIHAPRPGYFQADLTFYHGAKFAVFGLIDVFSRWGYYEMVKSKAPDDVAVALKNAFEAFKKLAPHHSIYKVATDGGSEFKGAFRDFLLNYKEDPEKFPKWQLRIIHQKQPQRLIESLNGTLRKFVERVDFKNRSGLVQLIKRFITDYNSSRHSALGTRTPIETVKLADKKIIKAEAKRQFGVKKAKVSTSGFKLRKLVVGSKVRVSLLADKVAVGHKGSKPHWSKTIYEVKRIMKSKRGKDRYVIHTEDGDRHGTYFRDKLLAVSIPKYGMQEDEKELEASSGDEYEPVEVEESEDEAPAPQWAEAREQKEELDEKRAEPPKKKPKPPPPPPKKKPQPAPPAKKKPQPAPPKKKPKPAPPPAKKRPQRRVRTVQPEQLIRRMIKMDGDEGYIVEIYREKYYIIVFEDEEYTFAATKDEFQLGLVRFKITATSVKRLAQKFSALIKNSKREVDEEEDL